MCGLIGYIGAQPPDPMRIKLLFAINQERGTDSCGVYVQGHGIAKVAGKAILNLLPHMTIPDGNILLGHVRQGTQGSKIKENSHPFRVENLIQTHNGSLTNWATFARELGVYTTTNVDSHAMLKLFNKIKTVDENPNYIAEGLQIIEGAIAIMVHNMENPNEIYFYRNKERPLFFGSIDDSHLYFSSLEEGLLSIGIPQSRIIDATVNSIYTAAITPEGVVNVSSVSWEKVKKPLSTPNFHNAPQNPKNSTVLWSPNSHSRVLSKKSILSSIVDLHQNCQQPNSKSYLKSLNATNQNDDEPLALGTKVEFMTVDGDVKIGKIVSYTSPYPTVYIVKEDVPNSHLTFCHKDLIVELQEQPSAKVIKLIPESKFDSLKVGDKVDYSTDMITHVYGATVTGVYPTNQEVRVEIKQPNGGLSVSIIRYSDVLEIKPKKIEEEIDDFTPKLEYDCHKCLDTGVIDIDGRYSSCTCSTGKTIEVTNYELNGDDGVNYNNDDLNYENYDDACSLYSALINAPGFTDEEGRFERLNGFDVVLKSMTNSLEKGLIDDNDVKSFKENLMDLRCELYTDMITLAREKESIVV